MVRHWWHTRGRWWRPKAGINVLGMAATGLVVGIVAIADFAKPDLPIAPGLPLGWGAWLVVVVVPLLVAGFGAARHHFDAVARQSAVASVPAVVDPPVHRVVVPIARIDGPALHALRYARTLGAPVTAVHVALGQTSQEDLPQTWRARAGGVPLVIIDSPFRSLVPPLVRYLDELKRLEGAELVTVVLAEGGATGRWTSLLHARSTRALKAALEARPGFALVTISHRVPEPVREIHSRPRVPDCSQPH
jgi:hypothetical protein